MVFMHFALHSVAFVA